MSCASSTPSHRTFVDGGFNLPEAKQSVSWIDAEHAARRPRLGRRHADQLRLSLRREAVCGAVKRSIRRRKCFAATADDIGAFGFVLRDAAGIVHGVGVSRVDHHVSNRDHASARRRLVQLPLPRKSGLAGIVDGRLLVSLQEPWSPAPDLRFATDSLVSYDLAEWERDPVHARPSLVWAPGARQTLGGDSDHARPIADRPCSIMCAAARTRSTMQNGAWRTRPIALPENATVGLTAASDDNSTKPCSSSAIS